VAFIRVRRLVEACIYPRAAFTRVRRLCECGVYASAAFIRGWRLFECGVYSNAAFIPLRRLSECGVYPSATFIRGRRLSEGGVYLTLSVTEHLNFKEQKHGAAFINNSALKWGVYLKAALHCNQNSLRQARDNKLSLASFVPPLTWQGTVYNF